MLVLFGLHLAALATDSDCVLTEEDYPILKRELRELRSQYGRPMMVSSDTPWCENALEAIAKNDPLLGIKVAERSQGQSAREAVAYGLHQAGQECGAVLQPVPGRVGDWELVEVGRCAVPVSPEDRLLTLGYWHTGSWYAPGVSLRWNEQVGEGFSFLVDGAVQLSLSPLTERGPLSWRLMGGFDMAKSSLEGYYIGLRGGLQRMDEPGPTGEVEASVVGQGIMGRRWIWDHTTMQLGVGGMVLVPEGTYTPDRRMTAGPMVELRMGLAR